MLGGGGSCASCCPYIERGSGSAAPPQAESGMAFTDCWLQAGTTPALMSAACLCRGAHAAVTAAAVWHLHTPLQRALPRAPRFPCAALREAVTPGLSSKPLPPFPSTRTKCFVFVFSFPKTACTVITDVLYRLVRSRLATVYCSIDCCRLLQHMEHPPTLAFRAQSG